MLWLDMNLTVNRWAFMCTNQKFDSTLPNLFAELGTNKYVECNTARHGHRSP